MLYMILKTNKINGDTTEMTKTRLLKQFKYLCSLFFDDLPFSLTLFMRR